MQPAPEASSQRPPQPERLRIWQVDCPLLDAVLALSFDTGELLNCCQSAGVAPEPHECLAPAHLAILAAHRACHEPSRLAQLLERRLDLIHGRSLRLLASEGPDALVAPFFGRRAGAVPDLAGRLWAIATLAGEEFAPLRAHVRALVAMGGLLALRAEAAPRE